MHPIDFFWRAVPRFGDAPAVMDPERTLSYRDLARRVAALGMRLQALDPLNGSRICVGASNSVEHLIGILAVLASGKTWVPLNPRNSDLDLERVIAHSDPALLLLDDSMWERLRRLQLPSVRLSPSALEAETRHHDGSGLPAIGRPLGDPQAIKFTGGTTGAPKGVMQPYRSWNTVIVSQLHALSFGPTDRFLFSAPLTHGSSTYILPVLATGGCLVFPAESKPASLLDTIERRSVTLLFMPPVLINALADENALRRHRTNSLRSIVYGAAPMSIDKIRRAQSAFGPVLATTYGQTEAPQIITFADNAVLSDERLVSSVGRESLMTRIAIVNAEGRPAARGTEGEICVRGDIVMSGYWRSPERSAEVLREGWLHTGDLGYLDADGYLFLKGRKSDVIITGGFNVYPSDVEAALLRHPAVAECSVFGLEDEKWGEAVHAAICVRPGLSLSEADLISFAKQQVGSVLAPKRIHMVDQLPRTAVDKVSRTRLAEMIGARMRSEAGRPAD